MASLRIIFVIFCVIVVSNGAPLRRTLSSFVTTTNLGSISPVTETKILNVFIKQNPGLPQQLQDTRMESKYLKAFPIYPDGRALIHVMSKAEDYTGALEVYFNGGRQAERTVVNAINLSNSRLLALPRRISDEQILDAYMSQNGHLPRELRKVLRVRQGALGRATLYVDPSVGRYKGQALVTW